MTCKELLNPSSRDKTSPNNILVVPDWVLLDITTPYFNPKTKKYYITVELQIDVPKENEIQQLLEQAKRPGVIGLLDVYGKEVNEENILKLLILTESLDYYVSERPNPKCGENGEIVPIFGTKILVAVESKALDGLPPIELPFIADTLPIASKEIHLFSNELRSDINILSVKLKGYADSVANTDININVKFDKEEKRLRNFISVLENLLIANGFSLNQEHNDLIIIGLDNNTKPLYALIDTGQTQTRLIIGFDNFIKTKPVNPRTLNYLLNIDKIKAAGTTQPDVSLQDFLQKFTSGGGDIGLGSLGGLEDVGKDLMKNFSLGGLIKFGENKSIKTPEDKPSNPSVILTAFAKATITKVAKTI